MTVNDSHVESAPSSNPRDGHSFTTTAPAHQKLHLSPRSEDMVRRVPSRNEMNIHHITEDLSSAPSTTFTYFTPDTDECYIGSLPLPSSSLTPSLILESSSHLERIPDGLIYPLMPGKPLMALIIAPDSPPEDSETGAYFIRRPNLLNFDTKDKDRAEQQQAMLLREAVILQQLAQHGHPNMIRYHGTRTRRGRITGLVFDKHPYTLLEYLAEVKEKGKGNEIEVESFVRGLESVVSRLHQLGLAHNSIRAENIVVGRGEGGEGVRAVLVEFSKCLPFGKKFRTSYDGELKVSSKENDRRAVKDFRSWLEGVVDPTLITPTQDDQPASS
ncbi:hypothetical protein QC763_301195 [Podospora pseudopauciseta]|uniref:Protein kinase domain-containing protein n=1 Tax=Podospora pseudopauciseta TaxID=2093780 RepID=A0ABR0HFB3_9PEZI|nr:hypothetical protein QC763_301195 [Podospora pseudopauciseta]